MGRESQIVRHYAIINRLKSPAGMLLSEIASELDVSIKTIRRDISALEDAGYPIYYEHNGKEKLWKLVEEFRNPPDLRFNVMELLSIYHSRKLLLPLKNTVLEEPLQAVFEKIKSAVNPAKLSYFDELTDLLVIDHISSKQYKRHNAHITRIRDAVLSKNSLKIKYFSLYRKKETTRTVDPYQLWYQNNCLYMIAFCHFRNEIRLFAVDRIRELQTLSKKFIVKPEFNSQEYREDFFNVRRGTTKHTVKIQLSSPWADWVREKTWHPSQKIVLNPDKSIVISFQVTELEGIKRWVLGFGAAARVLEPPRLKTAVKKETQKILSQYSE